MATEYKKPKKIKIFLLSTILITIGGVLVAYIGFRRDSTITESVPESAAPGAALSVGKVHQTATRKGKKEWSLDAGSAHYIKKMNQMILKDLKVTFFLNDNSEVYLVADHGLLKTDSKDIEVSGNVMVNNDEYKLLTEKLSYAHHRRVLYSSVPVTIVGASSQVVADSILYDLDSKKLTLEGSVEATVAHDFKL